MDQKALHVRNQVSGNNLPAGTTAVLEHVNVAAANTIAGGARICSYMERLGTSARTSSSSSPTTLPYLLIPEKDEWLTPDYALGHAMWTGGTHSVDQYFWCEKCGAHSKQSVRNLALPCPNVMKNSHAANSLGLGLDPRSGIPLSSVTRRLTFADTGFVPDGNVILGAHSSLALSPVEYVVQSHYRAVGSLFAGDG